MALIQSIIPAQQFELIRERIGEILTVELQNQFLLAGLADECPEVWVERSVTWDKSEAPAVNVCLNRGDYDNENIRNADGTYVFHIDARTSAKYTEGGTGDRLAMLKVQKIAGWIRAILMNPVYVTLGFDRPSLSSVRVNSLQVGEGDAQDATSEARARVEVAVRVNETVNLKSAPIVADNGTTVKLELTDKGYKYEWQQERVFADEFEDTFQ